MERRPLIAAIIPARGGSKRLPGKNLRLLDGKSLVAHAILAARYCPLIDRVAVSTDDPAIARVSRDYGAEVIDRPAALATDGATSESVVAHALGQLRVDHFVLLQPTSPLRTSRHVHDCLRHYLDYDYDSAISVTAPGRNAHVAMELVRDELRALWTPPPGAAVCLQNGAIYVARARRFLAERRFLLEPSLAFVMDEESSLDVDTELDLALCELVLRRRAAARAPREPREKGRRREPAPRDAR